MPTLRRLIRSWDVSSDTFGDLTFSDTSKIRVNVDGTGITLKASTRFGRRAFPTGPGNVVTVAPLSIPRAVQFQLFQLFASTPENPNRDPRAVTAIRARLWNGIASHYWHDGAAWVAVVDAAEDWNTIEELTAALPSWDPSIPLGFVFELSTTDPTTAPTLFGFKVLYSIDIVSFFDDWIYGAIIQGFKDHIRGLADVVIPSTGSDVLDFGAVVDAFEDDMTISGVDAVWNETADPVHRADLLTVYDESDRSIVLSDAPPSGDMLLIRFATVPLVALSTAEDYDEVSSTPAIILERVEVEDLGEAPVGDSIVNVFTDPPLGVVLPPPRRTNILITLRLMASQAVDLHRLAESVTTFLTERAVITSPATGERATLRLTEGFDESSTPNLDDLYTGSLAFSLENVYNWTRPAVAAGEPGGERAYGVGRARFTVETDTDAEDLGDYLGGS